MPSSDPEAVKDANDPIKHVILLLMENRSFDQMLGCFKQVYPDMEGVDENAPGVNLDPAGKAFKQLPTKSQQMPVDPRHETINVLEQLEDKNSGFVRNFSNFYGATATDDDRQLIMSYYPLMSLHGLHRLARDFTICDHWFSSVPGPTWPNRFFAFSGTSNGKVDMPDGIHHLDLENAIFDQGQTTLFDRLSEAGRSWKVYYFDFPSSLILTHQRHPSKLIHYHKADRFFQDAVHGTLPEFSLIEPKYAGKDQNDDHPPHNIMKGEKLIADVYNALRSNDEMWKSSLLVVLFDEHGGFYDHLPPPAAVPTDPPTHGNLEYSFDRLGVRVPAVLVSPYAGQRVEQTQFDHTSLLKYLINKWDLGSLGPRTSAAASIGVALNDGAAREDTIPFIRISTTMVLPPRADLEMQVDSNHQLALQEFARALRQSLGDVAGELEEVANPSGWMKTKARLGKQLIAWGEALSHDLDDNDQKRIQLAVNTIVHQMKSTAPEVTNEH
jgi:phospholipase C